ncbi:MAG: response regulator [Epsilonproteobacteria bacterium]|nr:response regulator [Campylobacterota bacterium]
MRTDAHPYLKQLKCLYVEDEEMIRGSFSKLLQKHFKEVIVATNGQEGIQKYTNDIDIVITDIRMPQISGIEMVKQIKAKNPFVFVIFVTVLDDMKYLKEAINLGVEGYISKPVEFNKLIDKLNQLAEILEQKHNTKKLLTLLQEIFDTQPTPMILLQNQQIKLANQAFSKLFSDVKTIEDLNEYFHIDYTKQSQSITIYYENKEMLLNIFIRKIDDTFCLISFKI